MPTSVYALPGTARTMEWMLLASAGVLAGVYGLKIPGVDVRISVSDTFFLALAVLFGPAAATVGTAIDCAVTSWRRQYGFGRLLFNASGPPLSLLVAAHVFFLVAGVEPLAGLDLSIGRLLVAFGCMDAGW